MSEKLFGEYDASGNPVYETVYLASTPVGILKQTGTAANSDIAVTLHNAYADHIDTIRVITKQDHAIVWRWDTAEAFGGTAPDQNPSSLGTFVYNPRFPGQVFDSETGLMQNVHREYDPRTGRYRQADPLGIMSQPAHASRISPKLRAKLSRKMPSLNHLYSYVDSDPLNKSDPEGLEPAAMSVAPFVGRGALLGGLRGVPGGVVGIALGVGIGVLAQGACEPSDRDRIERQCDADYDAGQKFCHAMAATKGRHKGTKKYAETYSQCMQAVDEAYVECYQEAGKP